MKAPLSDYKPVDLGARQDASLQQKPEKYFWLIFYVALLIGSIGGILYGTTAYAYRNVARIVGLVAFAAIIVAQFIRQVRARRV